MATFIREHDQSEFLPIIAELTRQPLEKNTFRKVAGPGRTQTFGFSRRASYRPWVSRTTWRRIDLYQLLLDFAEANNISNFDAIQVNQNYATAPHKDTGNFGESYIVGFGDYVGGSLMIGETPIDIKYRGHTFNGAELLHSTSPFEGTRYSIVFFRIQIPEKFGHFTCKTSIIHSDTGKLLRITDSYDDSEVILNKKGLIVQTVVPGRAVEWKGYLTDLKARH